MTEGKNEYPYVYRWGNNAVRRKYKGKYCRIVHRGRMNSVMVEFENGDTLITSLNALAKRTGRYAFLDGPGTHVCYEILDKAE